MTAIFKSPGVYVEERDVNYWLPPEVMKGIRQTGLSMTRRMKVAKIFNDESLYPKMKDGPVGISGELGHPDTNPS